MKKIPIPLNQHWLQFRMQAVPFLVCGGAILAITFLWQEQSAPPSMAGEVEAVVNDLASPGSGTLMQLYVDRFQEVEAGASVGQVITTPPDVLQASLAVLRSEIELTRLGWIDPLLDQQRNALQLESLKLDWLDKAATVAIRKIELQQAEREYSRISRLFETRFVSEEDYERAQSRVSVLRETVAQEASVADQMERSLGALSIIRDGEDFAPAALRATLALQEERLRLTEAQLRPVALVAPVSGTISAVYRRNGQHVTESEPILSIQSPQAERIVAYLRQPFNVEPEVGMQVEVARRNGARQRAMSSVLYVGPHIEAMGEAFRRPFLNQHETGLPLVIALPSELELRPGELVDVTLRPH